MAIPGLLLVDKPSGLTSHDVVSKVRKLLGTRKVGHAGTLDPMATGLLVLGVEAGTKLLTFVVGKDKTYLATIRLGSATVTDDKEGEVIFKSTGNDLSQVSLQLIKESVSRLTGVIQQRPSSVSAIKVDGERAYARVRAGEEFELPSREVTVSRFEVVGEIRFEGDHIDLDVEVDCSSGTYIRALARDLGSSLGVGGHLVELRRTRIGNFQVESVSNLSDIATTDVIPLTQAAQLVLPSLEITVGQAVDLRHGKQIPGSIDSPTCLISANELVAIAEAADKSKLRSLVVFSSGESDV